METTPTPNGPYKFAALLVRPFLTAIAKRTWLGTENLPASGGVIVAINHVSGIDPLTMAHYLYNQRRPARILAKSGLFKIPGLGWIMRRTGMIPVYRGTSHAADSLVDARAALDRGECVAIFPEGTITRDPDGWPMTGRPGAARLALDTGYPLVPLAMWGQQRILPHGTKLLRVIPRKAYTAIMGPPIDFSDITGRTTADYAEATRRIMGELTKLVADLRGESPPPIAWDMRKPNGGR